MTEQEKYGEWVDRYVRDELSEDEVVAFEERLLEDPGLQRELEAVLAIRKALQLDAELPSEPAQWAKTKPGANQWSSMAIAASVVLAIVSTTFYWRTSVEAGRLQEQVNALQAPRTAVLNVPVNIMRTAGDASPDAIVQVPAGNGVIVLDIELSAHFQSLASIDFRLQADGLEEALKWTAPPSSSGRARVVLFSETIPGGRAHLQISNPSGDLTETRLLEFRITN
jgi:hypothetical protein